MRLPRWFLISPLLAVSSSPASTSPPPSPPLDLSSRLLPSSLPAGDPETFALPVFLEEPSSTFVSRDSGVAQLRCRAAHATKLYFECNDEVMRSTNETEGRMDLHDGSNDDIKFRAISLNVKRAEILDLLGEYSCRCLAVSAVGQVESHTVTVDVAYLRKDFETPPYSTHVEVGGQTELRCHPPRGRPEPHIAAWLRNGVPIDPSMDTNFIISTTGHLILQQARLEDTANYSCVAANIARQRTSDPALLTVYIPGSWGEWSGWSECNVACGRGVVERTRICDSPAPVNGGPGCEGPAIQKKSCTADCPAQDGGWAAWSGWTGCSPDCIQVRRRACTEPPPANGGRYCQGKDIVSRNCTGGHCRSDSGSGQKSLLPVVVYSPELGSVGSAVVQQGDGSGGDNATAAASDLTLYIGLGVAFLVFVLVSFVIVRLLQRRQRSAASRGYIAAGYSEKLPPPPSALYSPPNDLAAVGGSTPPVVCYEYTYNHSQHSDTNSIKKGIMLPVTAATPFLAAAERPLSEHYYEQPMRVFSTTTPLSQQPSPSACSHRSNCSGNNNSNSNSGLPISLGLPRCTAADQVAWTRVGEAGTRVTIPRSAVSLTVPQGAIEPGRTEEVWISVVGGEATLRPPLGPGQTLIAPVVLVGPSHLSAHLRKPVVVSIPHSGGAALRQVTVLQCDRLDGGCGNNGGANSSPWRVVAISDEEDTASSTSVYKDATMCQLVTERLAAFALATNAADLLANSNNKITTATVSSSSSASSSGCSSIGSSPTIQTPVPTWSSSPPAFRIPSLVKTALCRLLDPQVENNNGGGGDWRTLAERLGVDRYMGFFSSQPSPTEAILNLWEARHRESTAVAGLVNLLRGMGRHDAAQILDQDTSWP